MNLRNDCIQCGYCCTVCACEFGTWDEEKKKCTELTEYNKCKKYRKIIQAVGLEGSPGFGGGCSSTLFNNRRNKRAKEIVRELILMKETGRCRGIFLKEGGIHCPPDCVLVDTCNIMNGFQTLAIFKRDIKRKATKIIKGLL